MSFSDADLKRLKDSVSAWDHDTDLDAELLAKNLEALLARLEAAEYALVRWQAIPGDTRTLGIDEAMDKWRKAAGK